METSNSTPPVTVLMATYEGMPFLSQQLASLTWQRYTNWSLLVSDDGSCDETRSFLRAQATPARLTQLLHGPKQGSAANFLHGFAHTPSGHYIAFCDQDDLWLPDKLERAVAMLATHSGPAFYSSDRYITNQDLQVLRQERRGKAGFSGLLARGAVAGNTLVLNPPAAALLRACLPMHCPPFHDWWASLVLVGAGATWVHDPRPSLLYRQHDSNCLGATQHRLSRVFRGTHFRWMQQTHRALKEAQPHLLPAAQYTLARISRRYRLRGPAQLRYIPHLLSARLHHLAFAPPL